MSDKKNASGSIGVSMFWSFLERISAQLVSVIVGIILARLLTPDEYGIIAIVMIFITLCDVFVTSGFGTALVQRREVSSIEYNTAFWLSFFISLILYAGLFFAAPLIADFYELEMLTPIIRVFGIRLILTSLNTIQLAKVQREMQFKKYFVSTIIGTVISCIIGVVMAYKGFGAWSLVAQYLSNTFIATLVFVFVCDWIPKFQFSFRKAKEIWRFGSKVLGANLISTGVLEIQSFLIGKHFGPADLAVMDQGKKYPSLLVNNVNSAISKAMLPYFSKNQENRALLKNKLRQTVKFSNYLLCPLLFGFCAVAPTFVDVVLTSKWSACVPYIQIFSIMYLTRPLTMIYHQVLLAIDKAGLAMALMSGINAVALLGALFSILVLKEMFAVVIFLLVADLIALVGFIIAMRVCLSWHIKEQLMDILPPVLLSVVMFAVVGFLPYLIKLSGILMLGLQILVGFLVYLCLSLLFRVEAFTWILEKGKGFLNKNKGN
ncbi:MAG: lipopolysaccharide biosynthesis protein [Clostridia bacterium]|nr:lipopolysaccharide biosynthesis protein [Clostridia bacterium]